MRQRRLELDGIKKCYSKSCSKRGGKILTHIRLDDNRVEKRRDRLIFSPHLISPGLSVSLSSLYVCLFLPLSLDCSHTNTGTNSGCWSRPPLRSSNMKPGSWMIKAVAGGLHFETINRPPGAESNSKPSISVSPRSRWHQGRGHTEGEGADSTSASSLYASRKNRRAAKVEFLTLWCNFKQALWIHPADPVAYDRRVPGRWSKGNCFLQHLLFPPAHCSLQTLIFNELQSNRARCTNQSRDGKSWAPTRSFFTLVRAKMTEFTFFYLNLTKLPALR